MDNKTFKVGDMVIYTNGDRKELGCIKRICDDGENAFVWYHTGDTASRTSFRDIEHVTTHKGIINEHAISVLEERSKLVREGRYIDVY